MKTWFFLFAFVPSVLFSQNKINQNAQVFGYNLALGAIIGGVSELIANPRHVKPLKAFFHGFCSGTIGGAFNYAGKYYTGAAISKGKYAFVLPVRLISSLGNSIIYNTGHSTNFYFQYFNFDFGFIQFSADVLNKKTFVKVLPGAIGGIIASANMGGKTDWQHSLLTGVPCFTKLDTNIRRRGYSFQTSITVNDNPLLNKSIKDMTRAHEMIHVLQCQEYNNTSNIFLGWLPAYRENRKVWKYFSADLPFHDAAYILNSAFLSKPYADNFFEFEARHFTRDKDKPAKR